MLDLPPEDPADRPSVRRMMVGGDARRPSLRDVDEATFQEVLTRMEKDSSVWDLAGVFAVQDVIRPDDTRRYLMRMLEIHRLRRTGGVGKHLMASWPTTF